MSLKYLPPFLKHSFSLTPKFSITPWVICFGIAAISSFMLCFSSAMVLGLEMKTLLLRYPIKSNHRRRDQANVPAMEHRRHGKWCVVETFPAEHSLMPLLCGLLLPLAETILMRDWSHDDVTLVYRSCVALPHSTWMSQ